MDPSLSTNGFKSPQSQLKTKLQFCRYPLNSLYCQQIRIVTAQCNVQACWKHVPPFFTLHQGYSPSLMLRLEGGRIPVQVVGFTCCREKLRTTIHEFTRTNKAVGMIVTFHLKLTSSALGRGNVLYTKCLCERLICLPGVTLFLFPCCLFPNDVRGRRFTFCW